MWSEAEQARSPFRRPFSLVLSDLDAGGELLIANSMPDRITRGCSFRLQGLWVRLVELLLEHWKMKLGFLAPLAISVLLLLPTSVYANDLDGLAGVWTGTGSMKPIDGPRERIRCRATYTVKKPHRSLDLALLCASDAYKLNLQANIEQNGDELSGNWFEREYRQGGKIVGKNNAGNVEARIEGNTVAALVSIQTKADRQAFSMDAPGAWVSKVSIDMNRTQK